MGNHTVGRAMGKAAELALKVRTDQSALELLDTICNPYRGRDAEFESEDPNNPGCVNPDFNNYTDPNGPIGVMITEAFGEPGRDYVTGWMNADSDAVDAWWGGPYWQFRKRYGFY